MCCCPSTPTLSPALPPLLPASFFCFCFIAVRTLWLNLSARCLSSFTGRFNRPTPPDSTPSSRLWCIPTQCAALPFLSGLSPLRSPLLHNPGVHAGALGFNPMLLPKLDQREIPRSRDRGNSYRSNPGSPSIRGSGSCLRLCRVVFACYTPTGGSRPTPAGAGQGRLVRKKHCLSHLTIFFQDLDRGFFIQDNKEEHITTIRSEAERVINRTLPVCRPLTEVMSVQQLLCCFSSSH